MALISGDSSPPERQTHKDAGRIDRVLAVVGVVLGVLGLVVSVLFAIASAAAAMLAIGVVLGVPIGVLLGPLVQRGAAWLAEYLRS